MDSLKEYYSPKEWNVHIEEDASEVKRLLTSTGVTCWAQGPIGETGYYQLVTTSPETKGSKRLAIVCKVELVKENPDGSRS